ncbi:MAG: PAS domain-containing protein [Actinomycetota bacterium]|nr:PAS domain S-box protein [Actinomycetota bacterium]
MTPETILDTLDIAVYSKDRQGRYTYANRMVQEIFGAPLDEIVGHDDSEFFDLEVSNDLKVNDEAVMTSGQAVAREERDVVKETGEERVYWTIKAPLTDGAGNVVGLCGISLDITDRS